MQNKGYISPNLTKSALPKFLPVDWSDETSKQPFARRADIPDVGQKVRRSPS
jgi:hypothetical protein